MGKLKYVIPVHNVVAPSAIRHELRGYFGTARAALLNLGLAEQGVSLLDMSMLCRGAPVRPSVLALVTDLWLRYKEDHNVEAVPLEPSLVIPSPKKRPRQVAYIRNLNERKAFRFREDW